MMGGCMAGGHKDVQRAETDEEDTKKSALWPLRTQISLKFGSKMNRRRHKTDALCQRIGTLGHPYCPRRLKRTAADEVNRFIEVALRFLTIWDKRLMCPWEIL